MEAVQLEIPKHPADILEGWLRDLAYHWKSEKPPASEKLKKIGLLEAIEGGDTFSQNA